MLPTEAKNQKEQIRKLTPQNFPKATHAVLVLEAQRKVKGRRAFAASLLNAGLGSALKVSPAKLDTLIKC